MPPLPVIPETALPARKVRLLVVHCSATPSGRRLDGTQPPLPTARTAAYIIDGWHRARGFKRGITARNSYNWRLAHIGYHFVLDLDGTVATGRHVDEEGAHVAGHNAQTIGICLIGGAERDARYTPAQWESLAELVTTLARRYDLEASAHVVGHRDLSPDTDRDGVVEQHEWLKTCPGFDVRAWVARGMRPLPTNVIKEQ